MPLPRKPAVCPDCGQHPAVHHDGSGWFCEPCRKYVAEVTSVINGNIAARRLKDETNKRLARNRNWRRWYRKNKARYEVYHRTYNRLYGRGLRDFGLHAALQKELAAA